MNNQSGIPVCSKASPEEMEEELKPLVDFQEEGLSLETLNAMIEERLVPHLMRYDLPGFQSMFNAFPEEGAELGAKIALSYNQGVTNWQVSPGGVMLEELCCKALCKLFGFSENADATFMASGTYGNQEALYLALHKQAEKEGFNLAEKGIKGFKDPSRLIVLTSYGAHFSVKHAVRMLGLGEESLRFLAVDEIRRIDVNLMKETVKELQESKDIFCVFITAGTTSTGSVDPIPPIAKICKEIGAWLHVDGAYGFAYSLVPEWKHLFEGAELADSLCWNPHKQLGIPIPNSLLFVRRWEDFGRMTVYSDYFNRREDPEPNPGLKSPPSTRPFSALALVTSLRHQGMTKVIQRLQAPLDAIKNFYEDLKKEEDIELCHQPDTGILCFRIIPDDFPEKELDNLQRYVYDGIMVDRDRTISLTKLDDKTVLRVVAISPVVTTQALMETISIVKALAKEFKK
ncbi:MAG: aspartate aminotransferase family protein [Candidatus Heimdallarchaeota archaeon]|nr:aspartate aminotransferase family protein [Candidatus Heimdallarchaeota archaeon]MBY8995810.1 aspartate aminotransferase family protein [Candidatus Heimdallarchaeota archaeon]